MPTLTPDPQTHEFVTFKNQKFFVTTGDGYLGLIDLGIKAISEIGGLSEVQGVKVLNLGGNQITEVRSFDFNGTMLGLEELILECNPICRLESLKHLTSLDSFILREHNLPDGFDFASVLPENANPDVRRRPYLLGRVGTIAAIKERWPFNDTNTFITSDIADDFTDEEAESLDTPFILRFSIQDGGENISLECQKEHLRIVESPTWDAGVQFKTLKDLIAYFNCVSEGPSEALDNPAEELEDPSEFLEDHEVMFLQNEIAARAGFKYIFWCISLEAVNANSAGINEGYQAIHRKY